MNDICHAHGRLRCADCLEIEYLRAENAELEALISKWQETWDEFTPLNAAKNARVTELEAQIASWLRQQKHWEAIDMQRVNEICTQAGRIQGLEVAFEQSAHSYNEEINKCVTAIRLQAEQIKALEEERLALHSDLIGQEHRLGSRAELAEQRASELEAQVHELAQLLAPYDQGGGPNLWQHEMMMADLLREENARLREALAWVWNAGVTSGGLKDAVRGALWPKGDDK